MPEDNKVVVIHLEPGKPVQVGEVQVKLVRVRDGRAKVEIVGPESVPVHRLDSEEPGSLESK